MAKATTVRFTEELYQRLDQASARTGLPVNSIVIAACLEWMQRHLPDPGHEPRVDLPLPGRPPRWATVRRAVEHAVGHREPAGMYPFDRFSAHAQQMLQGAQREAEKSGFSYIGTEHLLLAAYGNAEFRAAVLLHSLGVEEGAVRSAIDKAIQHARPAFPARVIPTSRVKRVIEIAFGIASKMGHPRVGTDHILLALAAEREGIAAHVLTDLGATLERIEAANTQQGEPES
jgi:ATP-dependent Clp protease ATP-binding subunit ClpC